MELTPIPMADSQPDSNVFSVRIVSIDYYTAAPLPGVDICYSSFQGDKVNEVPVIRIYGSTPAGQKTCLHVHQALPYLYVPCADIPLALTLEGDSYIHAVSLAVEKALKLRGNAAARRQHVHGCSLVRAKRFYGYHASEELFVKIYLYNPHDIARAAKLLLASAVFDKSVQPHESHIPYLLQFLVDYNLYGMGHLHVTKMKFRNPVPASFSSKLFNYNSQLSQESNNSASQQAELIGDALLKTPVWVTSTVPGSWRWQIHGEYDTPSDQRIDMVKRQSVCELEGDATVDDIVNQQFKTYTSLSQAHSDLKMVQSLVPIWEEFERTGMHGAAVPSDPGKPPAEYVLRILSLGLELEHKFKELCGQAENVLSLSSSEQNARSVDSIPLSSDERKLVDFAHANLSYKCGEHLQHLLEKDGSLSPLDLSHEEKSGSTPSPGKESRNQSFLHENKLKGADNEALSLLKWLATSQAVEDINSDDELAREIILSPLLPASTVDEVLEKATMDYESESQRECQDILDSVDDVADLEGLKERVDSNYAGPSPEKRIPQVDGSCDDLDSSPSSESAESESEKKSEHEKISEPKAFHYAGKSSSSKMKMKSSSWGSLPLSIIPKEVSNLETKNFDMNDGSPSGDKDKNLVSSSLCTQSGAGNCLEVSIEKVASPFVPLKEAGPIGGRSMRDLMRKKRHHRFESYASYSERKGDVSSCPEITDLAKLLQGEGGVMESVSCPDSCKEWHPSHYDDQTLKACSNRMHFENLGIHNGANEARKELNSSHGEQEVGASAGLSASGTTASAVLDVVDESSRLISMIFHDKPPTFDWSYEASENVALANAITNKSPFLEGTSYKGFSGNAPDEIPPFFVGGFQEEKELQNNSLMEGEHSCYQEVVMGIPTHYLNDGSCLYLLTPAVSPPSVDTVSNWLSSHEGASRVRHAALMEASPLKGSSDSPVVGSQSSFENYDGAVPGRNSPPPPTPAGKSANCSKEGNVSACTDTLDSGSRKALRNEECTSKVKARDYSQEISQISGPDRKSGATPLSQLGFRDPASVGAGQQLTIMSLEVQAESRGDLRPDPRFDAINVLTLAVMADDDASVEIYVLLHSRTDFPSRNSDGLSGCKVLVFPEEKHLFLHFIKIISKLDPDILVGWDVQGGSIGYLAERASYLGIGLLNLMSRTPSENKIAAGDSEHLDKGLLENVPPDSLTADSGLVEAAVIEDEWGRTHGSGVHIGGRIILNLWRVMRGEVKLSMYTLEAVTEAILRQKTPAIPHKILTRWFCSGSGRARYRCIEYLIKRTKLNLQIMNQLDLVNRTSELARVFGIDFFSVLSRGSQYRVESMFLRLAHTQNYVAISPGNQQVASQPAMECIPLVMEPESGFYGDPVVVLDFQSLYPSMIIGYNLCFCTCLGKVSPSRENTLGVASFSPDPHVLRDLKDQIFLAPNGAMYVPPKVRKGILPRLLEEILTTRIMVKQAMKKLGSSEQVLHRIFNARQLALKLIANVTYGYTAAGFSGRMPCAELADSIVQCGRRTLENAISYVNARTKWNARVIYGDTDSMFVLLKGRSVKEAFRIGQEIESAISGMNPDPVTLKMEKVYHPCFLLTKKRYVGYSYESPDQVDPIFDAKGIETVRRDTCGAVAKAMDQTLRLYFEHQDMSKVKTYLYRQWTRILSGRVSLQDFVFAKEVRLGTYSTRPSSSLPPAAIVATKAMRIDPRAEPRYGERVPYVVVHGEPGARLVDMVVDPLDLLALNSPFRLNGLYYITKQIIPALRRVFGLVRADLNQWFVEMPRPTRENLGKRPHYALNPQKTRIDYYYLSRHCVLCGEVVPTSVHLCSTCSQKSDAAAAALTGKTSKLEKETHHLAAICRHCGGGDWVLESGVKCTSLACSVFYERRKVQKELQSLSTVATEAGFYPKCAVEWF